MKMTKRWVACSMLVALAGAGCKKKHEDASAGGGSSAGPSATGASGDSSAVAPSPAASAASALATSAQQALVETGNKFRTAPVAEQVASISKLIDAAIASGQSEARDRSWDPASVIKSVGTDRAKLFAWVRDQTRLVPYTGVLRGSVGVMMDRVGNSLDRSLLLANLLKQAGGEARLAHATLDQANADKLAAEWWKATPPTIAATPDDPAITASLIAALGPDPAAIQKRLADEAAMRADIATKARAQVDTQVGALAKLIEGTPVAAPTDAAVLADHWWVQVKDGDAWTDLDLAESTPGTSLVQATETMATTDVPEAMRHTLAIRVIGEVWHDDKREEAVLVDHAFTPAEFFGQRLTITGSAIDLPDWEKLDDDKDRAATVHASFVSQVEWFPMIVMGATPIVHYSVDDNGELWDLMDPNAATTRLGRGVARATKNGVGGATDMLAGMPDGTGSDQPPPAKPVVGAHSGFTAEWVEIEVRAPNAPPRVVRRPMFDELGAPADRSTLKPTLLSEAAKFDRTLAMLGEIEVLPQFARAPRGYVANQLAAYLTVAKPALVAVVQRGGKAIPAELKAAANSAPPPPDELDRLGADRFFASSTTFIDRLDVLTARRRMVSVDGAMRRRQVFDIVTNGVGAWGPPAEARKARLAQGIADTVMESVLLPCIGDNDKCFRGPNTSDAFIAATSWSMTASSTPAVAALPVEARRLATSDLASGYSLVLPPGGKPVTWWRVRGDTGEVLGQGPVGGITSTETVIMNIQAVGIGGGLGFCAAGYRGLRLFGCITAATLGAAALTSTGIMAAALGTAATIIGGASTTTPYRGP